MWFALDLEGGASRSPQSTTNALAHFNTLINNSKLVIDNGDDIEV